MTITEFIDTCEQAFGEKKMRLMPNQRAIYEEKLRRFTGPQLSALFDKVVEETKYFPKVADVYAAARDLGFMAAKAATSPPHTWQAADCKLCAGSGMVAAFWSQEWERSERGPVHVLRLVGIMPYHQSAEASRTKTNYDVRTLFRCSCVAGSVTTLPKGWPQWSTQHPVVLERIWG